MAVDRHASRGRPPVDSDRILRAACRVFSKRGFFQSTLEDVRAEAGIGKGTIYRHFRNKEQLLTAVLLHTADALQRRIDPSLRGDQPIDTNLRWLAREILSFFSERPELFRIFVREGALSIPAVRQAMGAVVRQTHARTAALLGGKHRRHAAEVFNHMVFGVLRQKIGFMDEPIHPDREAAFLVDIFLNGIRKARP